MSARIGGQVPDAQGAPADAEQALSVRVQLLHWAAVPCQRAYALALLQVPHLRPGTPFSATVCQDRIPQEAAVGCFWGYTSKDVLQRCPEGHDCRGRGLLSLGGIQ